MNKTLIIPLFALGLLAGTAARAQPAPGGGSQPEAWHHRHHVDRLAQLKAQLKITAAQEPAWNAFAAAMQAMRPQLPEASPAKTQAGKGQLMPAPERFEQMAERAAQRAGRARDLANAMKKLYEELTPVQRAIVDTHMADMRHGMHHHRHMEEDRGGEPRPMPPGR